MKNKFLATGLIVLCPGIMIAEAVEYNTILRNKLA